MRSSFLQPMMKWSSRIDTGPEMVLATILRPELLIAVNRRGAPPPLRHNAVNIWISRICAQTFHCYQGAMLSCSEAAFQKVARVDKTIQTDDLERCQGIHRLTPLDAA
jgi:hypothetical protein